MFISKIFIALSLSVISLASSAYALSHGLECRPYDYDKNVYLDHGPTVLIHIPREDFFSYDNTKAFVATVIPTDSDTAYDIQFQPAGHDKFCRKHLCQGEPSHFRSIKYQMDLNLDNGPGNENLTLFHNDGSWIFPRWTNLGDFQCEDTQIGNN